MELDLLAVGPTKLLVVEAKWRVAAGEEAMEVVNLGQF
jgi:hypothetical protein